MEQDKKAVLLIENDQVTEKHIESLFETFYPHLKVLVAEGPEAARRLSHEYKKSLIMIIIDDFQQNSFMLRSFIIDMRLNREFTGDLVAFSPSPRSLVQMGCNKVLIKPCGVRDLDLLLVKWR